MFQRHVTNLLFVIYVLVQGFLYKKKKERGQYQRVMSKCQCYKVTMYRPNIVGILFLQYTLVMVLRRTSFFLFVCLVGWFCVCLFVLYVLLCEVKSPQWTIS